MALYEVLEDGTIVPKAGHTVGNLDCLRTELLWTNSNTTSTFNEQTIKVDLSKYDGYRVIFGFHTTAKNTLVQEFIKTDGVITALSYNSIFRRNITYSDDGLTFSSMEGYKINGTTAINDNNYLIPYKIEGILKTPAMIYTGKELFNDPVSAGVTRIGQHDTVSEYYMSSDGNTWYRKWASGWKECGGKIAKDISGRHKVTFPLTFSNTSFTLLKTLNWQSNDAVINRGYFGFQDITTNSAYTYSYTPDGYDEGWYACGY